jgi:hypothetical protein
MLGEAEIVGGFCNHMLFDALEVIDNVPATGRYSTTLSHVSVSFFQKNI